MSALHGREVSIGDLSAEVGQSRSGRGAFFAGEGGYRVGAREAGASLRGGAEAVRIGELVVVFSRGSHWVDFAP